MSHKTNFEESNIRLSFVKFVNGESRFFPEDIYDVRLDIPANRLTIVHKPTNSISLETQADKVLYVRYHLANNKREENIEMD